MSKWRPLVIVPLLYGLASQGCNSSGSSSSCSSGYEGCACTAEGLCLSGLTCTSDNLCVGSVVGSGGTGGTTGGAATTDAATADTATMGSTTTGGGTGSTTTGSATTGSATTDSTTTDSTTTGGTSIDAAACISCWQAGCQTEVLACEEQPLCDEAMTCLETCLADDPEQCADCSAEGDTDAEGAFFAFSLCVDAECHDVCSGGASADECSEGDLPLGSCAADNGEICLGGQWQPEDCTGCALLQPADFCGHIRALALDPNDSWAVVRGGVGSLIHTSSSVEATFNFTAAGQLGIIQYRFLSPLPARGVNVLRTPAANVDITLENDDGSSGCVYSLDGAGDAYEDLGDGCWQDGGTFYSFIPYVAPGSAASLINIRLMSAGAGVETLTIEGVVVTLF